MFELTPGRLVSTDVQKKEEYYDKIWVLLDKMLDMKKKSTGKKKNSKTKTAIWSLKIFPKHFISDYSCVEKPLIWFSWNLKDFIISFIVYKNEKPCCLV